VVMGCCYCVEEAQVGVVENFGKYSRVIYPGCNALNPCGDNVIGTLSLRIVQYNVSIETRTKDNVFITITLAVRVKVAESDEEFPKPRQVQRRKKEKKVKSSKENNEQRDKKGSQRASLVDDKSDSDAELEYIASKIEPDPIVTAGKPNPDLVYNAYYKLSNPIEQIKTFIEQYFRFHGMEYTLDSMFAAKEELVTELLNELNAKMNTYGYIVYDVLVKDISPSANVRAAMNDVVASEKARIAQTNRAQAQKQARILAAEAEAKTRELEGAGVAAARRAIIGGLRQSVDDFQKDIPDAEPRDLLLTVLMTQYLDTLKEAAAKGKNTFILPSSPGNGTDMEAQMRSALLSSGQNDGQHHQQ